MLIVIKKCSKLRDLIEESAKRFLNTLYFDGFKLQLLKDVSISLKHHKHLLLIREAAKKVLLLVSGPLRGGGG